jgi:hypothetical protein
MGEMAAWKGGGESETDTERDADGETARAAETESERVFSLLSESYTRGRKTGEYSNEIP